MLQLNSTTHINSSSAKNLEEVKSPNLISNTAKNVLKRGGEELTFAASKKFRIATSVPTSGQISKSNLIGPSIIKRKAEKSKETRPSSKRRKIYSNVSNVAASQSYVPDKVKAIGCHAEDRIGLAFVRLLAVHNTALRTKNNPVDVKVWPIGATIQVGRGDSKNDASHSNLGEFADDLFAHYPIHVNEDQKLSPVKRAIIAKRVSREALDLLEKNVIDPVYVQNWFNKFLPPSSILTGTNLEIRLSKTINLPRDLNRIVDSRGEDAVRPLFADWTREVMQGTMTPREAAKKLVQALNRHFIERIYQLNTSLVELKESNKPDPAKILKLKNLILYTQTELNCTEEIEYDLWEKDFLSVDSKTIMPSYDLDKALDIWD